MSIDEAAEHLLNFESFIIKPALISGNGAGVSLYTTHGKSKDDILSLLKDYGANIIVQGLVKNHPDLQKLNPSSLNTCRIISYRKPDSGEYVILAAMVRFGGEGDIKDNASNGGGFSKIYPDGTIDDKIYSYRHFEPKSLSMDKDIDSLCVPNYEEMKRLCINSHKMLPYFDLIGWDFTVDDKGDIVLIEYNWAPTIGGIQITNGPLFGEYTEDLISRLSEPVTTEVNALKRVFKGGPAWNEYIFDLDKKVGL